MMQVTHAGYKDPNALKFENITVLGVPHPPMSVSVTHVSNVTHANSTSTLPASNIQYDGAKKVHTHGGIVMLCANMLRENYPDRKGIQLLYILNVTKRMM